MSDFCTVTINTNSLDETEALAARVANMVTSPAVLLLNGDIGAGKSAFARGFIRACGTSERDIPSPTFTLVQTYDTDKGLIWHSDLYRLTMVDEIDELGLLEAFDTAICLVEWPDRLQDEAPPHALTLNFYPEPNGDGRKIEITGAADRWLDLVGALA